VLAGASVLAVTATASQASPIPRLVQAPAVRGGAPISARDRVYTADQSSNTVTVINPATNRVLGTIPLGAERLGPLLGPQYVGDIDVHGMGFSPDGRYLDVISVTTNTVTVIRTATNKVVSQTYVDRASHEGMFSPDGKTVWVASRGTNLVDVVDPIRGNVIDRIPTADGPSKVVFSPNGRYAYVNHIRAAVIDVIDVKSRRVVRTIKGLASDFSSDEMISPDGQELWAAHKKTGQVSIIDLRTNTVAGVLNTGADTNHPNFVTHGQTDFAYLTVGSLNQTLVFQRSGNQIRHPKLVARVPDSGVQPHGLWPSADNTRLYVVNEKSDVVDVVDTATNKVIESIPNGQESQALVYVADAVPTGPGTSGLTRQGLDKKVVNTDIKSGAGKAQLTVRQLEGLDMIQVEASGLTPKTNYTLYGQKDGTATKLLSFTTNAKGKESQALGFTYFFGVYDPATTLLQPSSHATAPTAATTTTGPTGTGSTAVPTHVNAGTGGQAAQVSSSTIARDSELAALAVGLLVAGSAGTRIMRRRATR